ncbi:hypothetical protein [Psychromonas ossibalaenae]|uniref:hypothetical protein n=1 Tax=Psychromonas ossibalaenae TaxID=444922 RepID=UPI0003755A16|nr:hypothetical protein [Psychromonas ossibalaenae]
MINCQITILDQAQAYLESTNSFEYTQIVRPLFISSAGAHMRHILDHYNAIILGMNEQFIDYDKRRRGGNIETDLDEAVAEIVKIKTFLLSLSSAQLNRQMSLSTEVSVTEKQIEIVTTTLARELVFAGSHAIHHFAMIDQIAKAQQSSTPDQFGIAPATATFLRSEKCAL